VQLKVAGLKLTNFDPYQITQKTEAKTHPLSVSLNSVNYVSEKTKQALAEAFKEKIPVSTKTTADREEENFATAITSTPKYQQGHSKPINTMNEVAMTSISLNSSSSPNSTEIPLDRILNSLECSLSQFHLSQRETLEVHKQYLQYQSQYTQTFFGLMQQQSQLWTNLQSAPHDIGVKTAILQSAERSLTKFQEHQDNTLRVHEQYLNHQAQYAQNFFLLTQASYSQLLNGDLHLSFDRSSEQNEIRSEDYSQDYTENRVLTTEFVTAKQIASIPEASSNGYHPEAEVMIASNGNNGHHPEAFLATPKVAIETSNNGHLELESPIITDADLETATTSPLPEIDFATLSKTLLDVVSDKTGYPPEMLELDMDMEADLGIDSIKRVEILGGLQEQMPNLPQPELEDLSELHTLNQIIEYLRSFDSKKVAEKADLTAKSSESLENTFLSIVSEKTGYPRSSLNLEMNLRSDLGIDGVKRTEIFAALQQQIPSLAAEQTVTASLETLAQIIDYLKNPQKKTLKEQVMVSSLSN
jgi:acyl carrier protein